MNTTRTRRKSLSSDKIHPNLAFRSKHENNMGNDKIVTIGSLVTIKEGRSAPEKYHVVDINEAKSRVGNISNESPIGESLMGRRTGDKVTVETPGGTITFKILEVEY
ncbi:MAG: GreA/GreB family elongation factor [Anaerolineales bacterium]|nr:GreA/GreB family elongation factor [Anaerolineales bacterium]